MGVRRKIVSDAGFTIMEIIIAVLVLAIGLTTLIGLQTASVDQTLRDRSREIALLAGRRILAQIEADEDGVELANQEKRLDQLLKEFTGDVGDTISDAELRELQAFNARLEIVNWGIEQLNPEAMIKVILQISWGASDLDSVELVYFIPKS